MGGMHLLTK